MISDGILRAVEAFKSFDRTRNNPFAYFTLVIFRAFVNRIKTEKLKRKVVDKLILTEDIYTLQEDDESSLRDQILNELEVDWD